MAVLTSRTPVNVAPGRELPVLQALVLARIASAGGATRVELVRDLSKIVSHKLSPAEWRATAEADIAALTESGLVAQTRGRFNATEAGYAAADAFLGPTSRPPLPWPEQRDIRLIAKALSIETESHSKLKALMKPEGLRAFILQKAFGLSLKGNQSTTRLRAQLAVVALERAFGNKIKSGFNQQSGLSAKAGRLLAGQLAQRPRDFGSDGRLIAALAAEAVHSVQTDHDALRLAILRGFVSRALQEGRRLPPQSDDKPAVASCAAPKAANDRDPPALIRPASDALRTERPDLPGFAREVHAAALARAEGWPGNRKAFISHVWQAIRASRPEWGLSEIEFKCMLAEAHRAGHVVLANADLKDKRQIKELQDSAIGYKNTVWHFVRIED